MCFHTERECACSLLFSKSRDRLGGVGGALGNAVYMGVGVGGKSREKEGEGKDEERGKRGDKVEEGKSRQSIGGTQRNEHKIIILTFEIHVNLPNKVQKSKIKATIACARR